MMRLAGSKSSFGAVSNDSECLLLNLWSLHAGALVWYAVFKAGLEAAMVFIPVNSVQPNFTGGEATRKRGKEGMNAIT
jgi:hypothetical protein